MRISDWSSDVCSSDLQIHLLLARALGQFAECRFHALAGDDQVRVQPGLVGEGVEVGADGRDFGRLRLGLALRLGGGRCEANRQPKGQGERVHGQAWCRSEEHTSELQSLMRISYAVLCLKNKITINKHNNI